MPLQAVIFDLDGVITDTAEYHFRAWKRLADEEGIPFTREDNEQLRGVSRRASILLILKGREVPEQKLEEMMARKNHYYQEMLAQVNSGDLLPGVAVLLDELDEAGIPYGIASASRNASAVVQRLGIGERLAVLADGNSVRRPKPAPDLFRFAAAHINRPPDCCLVVEDAAAGVTAALNAGMPALAVGPPGRFAQLGPERGRFARRPDLVGVSLSDLQEMVPPDPEWVVVQEQFEPNDQHHMETVFTIGNGYFASRGSFAEGYPGDHSLTLAHGLFDAVPIVVTELVNLPDWLTLRLYIDEQPFRLDQGEILYFHRQLDLKRGIYERHVRWQAPNGTVIDLTFERFISYTAEHLGALRLLVTLVNQACRLEVATGIDGHVANENLLHWQHVAQGHEGACAWLHSRTLESKVELGSAAVVTASRDAPLSAQTCPGQPEWKVASALEPGQTLQVDKIVSYTSSRDQVSQAEDVVARALSRLAGRDYDTLKAAHMQAWQEVWQDIDVVVEGDQAAQRAVRFNLFQLQVAAPRYDDRVSIGAKTLSGLGYRGHVFWDTDIFIVPFFTYTQPDIARNLLIYRYRTLPGARRKAAANGYKGAQYAWESALTGDEVTPTWVPSFSGDELVRIWTGDIEIHISADVAYAVIQYWQVTGDDEFMREYGAEIVLDTARFWADRAEREVREAGSHQYSYRDVIGPDEYHDHVDNNIFTNRMAQWHLQTAQEVLEWVHAHYPEKAKALRAQLDISAEELAGWEDVIEHLVIPYNPTTGLMTQFEGFFDLEPVDWSQYEDRTHSMQYLLGIEGANRTQVIKQPDAIMLLCLLRDQYDQKDWQINWDVYMPITDHRYGSSLGPSFHAWAACQVDKPADAYDHFMLAALADLRNVRGNADDGIHAASAGGVWQAIAFGFAGLQLTEDGPSVRPCLPSHWKRLAFRFYYQGESHEVEITRQGGVVQATIRQERESQQPLNRKRRSETTELGVQSLPPGSKRQ